MSSINYWICEYELGRLKVIVKSLGLSFGNEFFYTSEAYCRNVVVIVCVGDVVFLLFDILLIDESKHTLLMALCWLSFLLLPGI